MFMLHYLSRYLLLYTIFKKSNEQFTLEFFFVSHSFHTSFDKHVTLRHIRQCFYCVCIVPFIFKFYTICKVYSSIPTVDELKFYQ